MHRLHRLILLLGLTLLAAQPASAAARHQAEKVASGSAAVLENLALENAPLSAERTGENLVLGYDFASGSPVAARGGLAAARELGQAGELAAGIAKNTARIESLTGTAAYRVPDILNPAAKVIGEVKNVGSLSYTNQLRDFAGYARANGYTFELFVRPTTQLSGPLQQAIANGDVVLRFLP